VNDNCFAGTTDCDCATLTTETVANHRIIRDPGQFEGQTPAIVHFWNIGMNGFADQDTIEKGVPVYKFRLTSADRAAFPELAGKAWLSIYQDDRGFIGQL
jgi:hypothetical protein